MTLTKHADEIAVKAHLGLEDATRVVESTAEAISDEALVVCDATVKPIRKSAPEIAPVKTMVKPLWGKMDKALHKLHDLERSGESEKLLNVDLDLYQMENY